MVEARDPGLDLGNVDWLSGLVLDYHQGSTKYQASYPEQARICLGQTSCSSAEVKS